MSLCERCRNSLSRRDARARARVCLAGNRGIAASQARSLSRTGGNAKTERNRVYTLIVTFPKVRCAILLGARARVKMALYDDSLETSVTSAERHNSPYKVDFMRKLATFSADEHFFRDAEVSRRLYGFRDRGEGEKKKGKKRDRFVYRSRWSHRRPRKRATVSG